MLTADNINKSYGPFPVLENTSFSLNPGMRAGLVGANGSGKTTLIKIIAGLETADSGHLSLSPSTTTGYLPQSLPVLEGSTVAAVLAGPVAELRSLETRLRKLERDMASAAGEGLDMLVGEYGTLSHFYEERGGYELDHRTDIVLAGLDLAYLDRSRPADTLSGGEKTRLGLAALLLGTPDILLLDEPTNNLDAAALAWLESYLASYKGAVLMASHDRQLLTAAANWIWNIDEYTHTLTRYPGNYDAYRAAKQQERLTWEEDYARQQEEIIMLKRAMKAGAAEAGRKIQRRDNDKFAAQFFGERSQAAARRGVRSARERLDRILADPVPKPPKPLRFKAAFTSGDIQSAEVLRVQGLRKSYNGVVILNGVDFTLGPRSRAVILGPNGCGKTTLIRLLVGEETPDAGTIVKAPGVKPGYLPQEPDMTDAAMTVLDYYRRDLPGREEDFIFSLVTCGLFGYDELGKTLGQLSLGQIRKLEIARLIAKEPNVLILDEPTNHLALDILESFEAAIAAFPGPVLAVSHDRCFLQQFDGTSYELKEGKLALL